MHNECSRPQKTLGGLTRIRYVRHAHCRPANAAAAALSDEGFVLATRDFRAFVETAMRGAQTTWAFDNPAGLASGPLTPPGGLESEPLTPPRRAPR